MKKVCKLSIYGIIAFVVIIILSVSLTGNVFKSQNSKYGILVPKSGSNVVYINDMGMGFSVPGNYEGCFADTISFFIADILKQRGITFAAQPLDDYTEYDFRIIDDYPYDEFSDDNWKQYLQKFSSVYDYKSFETTGEMDINGMKVYKYSSIRVDVPYREYDNIAGFIGEKDGKYFMLDFLMYSDKEQELSNYDDAVEQTVMELAETITFEKPSVNNSFNLFNSSFSLWIVLIPIIFISITNMNVCTKYGFWHDNMDRDYTKGILGIFSIFIIVHHLVSHVGSANAGIIAFMENSGVCFVGMFFFYSGYGLIKSVRIKKDYLNGFWKKRLPTVLVPFVVCNLIFVVDDYITGGITSGLDLVLKLTGVILVNTQMWYIIEIIFLYLIFYISFKYIKNEKTALIVMGLLVALMVTGSLLLGHGGCWFQGEWWYNTTFLFYIGILYEKFSEKITDFCKKHYALVVSVSGILFIVLFNLTSWMLKTKGYWTEYNQGSVGNCYLDKLLTLSIQLPMVIVFVFLIHVIGLKVRMQNKVTGFLGSISLETYLIHNIFINTFSFMGGAGILFVSVIICTIISAWIIHNIEALLVKLIFKKEIIKTIKIDIASIANLIRILKENMSARFERLKKPMYRKRKMTVAFRNFVCIILSIINLYPIYQMLVYGTKAKKVSGFVALPGGNFLKHINDLNLEFQSNGGSVYLGILNSCIIAFSSAILATYLGAMTAYALEKYKFKGRNFFWGVIIFCMLVPGAAGMAGYFKLIAKLDCLNQYWTAIGPMAAVPSAVYFIRMYLINFNFDTIVEAARIDGAKELKIFNRIILPMLTPVLALQLTFSFVASWNNGYLQTLLLMDWDKKTIASYIATMGTAQGISTESWMYALLTAACIVPMVVYIICSKSIVESITLGAVKE